MMEIHFQVDGEPQGKARPRFTRYGKPYTPKKTTDYENSIRTEYIEAGGECTGFPVKVKISAAYKIPKATSKAIRAKMIAGDLRPVKKPDLDNIAKAVCDALNGIAYKDDAQIVCLEVCKYYSEYPHITVTVKEVLP